MAWQLIYTSAARGLVAGRSGFCTVARHRELRDRLVTEIEQLSAYDRVTHPQLRGAPGPVVAAHRILEATGNRYHVLSYIQDAGVDYTNRNVYLAQHLIFEATEINRLPSPATILRLFPWRKRWEGEPRYLTATDTPDLTTLGQPLTLPAETWRQETGQADNAALLAERYSLGGCTVLTKPGGEKVLLPLYEEALLVLDPKGESPGRLWQVRFTTFLQASDRPGDFDWRGGWADRPPGTSSEASRSAVLDLTKPVPRPQSPVMAQAAEAGLKATVQTAQTAAKMSAKPTLRSPVPQMSTAPAGSALYPARPVEPEQPRRKNKSLWIVLGLLLLIIGVLVAHRPPNVPKSKVVPSPQPTELVKLEKKVADLSKETDQLELAPEIVTILEQVKALQNTSHNLTGSAQTTLSNLTDFVFTIESKSQSIKELKNEVSNLHEQVKQGKESITQLQQSYQKQLKCYTALTNQLSEAAGQVEGKSKLIKEIKEVGAPVQPDGQPKPVPSPPGKPPVAPDKPVLSDKPSGASPILRRTYLIKADLANGIQLKSLFDECNFGSLLMKDVSIKFVDNPQNYSTTASSGMELTPGKLVDGKTLQLRKKTTKWDDNSSWASIDNTSGDFRCSDANLKSIALHFEKGGEAFDVIVSDNKLSPLMQSRKCLDVKDKKLTLQITCIPKICAKISADSQVTRFRLTSDKLQEIIKELVKLRAPTPGLLTTGVAEINQDYALTKGEAAIDWAALEIIVTSNQARIEKIENQRLEAKKALGKGNPAYTAYVIKLEHAGKELLGDRCPPELASFSAFLKSEKGQITDDPWADCLRYLNALYSHFNEKTVNPYYRECTKMEEECERITAKKNEEEKLNKAKHEIHMGFQKSQTGRNIILEYLKNTDALTEWEILTNVEKNLKGLPLDDSAVQNIHKYYNNTGQLTEFHNQIINFYQSWQDLWSNLRPIVIFERKGFTGNKPKSEKPEQDYQQKKKKYDDLLNQIQQADKYPGNVSLEIEVAPNDWWPIMVFTETAK